jgi:signal transduction histidine kinase
VKLLVSDTGGGMNEGVLDRVFEPLFTTKGQTLIDRQDTRAGIIVQGTGLGLSVVQWIVKDHGGFIKIESKRGIGTRFSVYLPCAGGRSAGGCGAGFPACRSGMKGYTR